MNQIVAANKTAIKGEKDLGDFSNNNTHSTVENAGLKKAASEQQREQAAQRKALKKAQRDKARSLPPKPKIERPIPVNDYEIEMYRAVKAVHLDSIFALHRFLKGKGAGGYLVRLDAFSIDGEKLSPSEIEEMQPLFEAIPAIGILGVV